MSEYKEWALAEGYIPQKLDSFYGFDEAKEYFNKYELVNPIHIIEFSAFEKLQKDWEQAATQNYADKCEIEKLTKQLEVAREALEFYADLSSYYINGRIDLRNHIDDSDLEHILNHYQNYENLEWIGGKRARQALSKLDAIERGEG